MPILEKTSGLKYGTDFKVGYSPERINPGDKEHDITSIIKVVSGCDAQTLEDVANTYTLIVKAGGANPKNFFKGAKKQLCFFTFSLIIEKVSFQVLPS